MPQLQQGRCFAGAHRRRPWGIRLQFATNLLPNTGKYVVVFKVTRRGSDDADIWRNAAWLRYLIFSQQHYKRHELSHLEWAKVKCKYTNLKPIGDFPCVGSSIVCSVTVFEMTTFYLPKWSRFKCFTVKQYVKFVSYNVAEYDVGWLSYGLQDGENADLT